MIEACALNLDEHLGEKMIVALHDLNLETAHCGSVHPFGFHLLELITMYLIVL